MTKKIGLNGDTRMIMPEYGIGDFMKNNIFRKNKTAHKENLKFFAFVRRHQCEVDVFRGFKSRDGWNAEIGILGKDMSGHTIDFGFCDKTFAIVREKCVKELKERFKKGG